MQPDFIGIGAQKAGTSWIYACLDEHPQICIPTKEIHYFSKDKQYALGKEWYERRFATCPKKSIKGEFSTTYMHSEVALDRILNSYPISKILVSIREPRSRAKSHFHNDIMAGLVPKQSKLTEMLIKKPEYWQRGLYHRKIEWLQKSLGQDRLLILVQEDSLRNPSEFIKSIYQFLGVDDGFSPPSLQRKINVSATPKSVAIGKMLDSSASIIRYFGFNRLIQILRKTGAIQFLRHANSSMPNPTMTDIDWPEEIIEEFYNDRIKLERSLGRKLSCWD